MQAEGVEGDEHALVHHHRARAVGLADVRVWGVAVDSVSARQVSWVRVDRRVNRYPRSDPQDEHARHESLFGNISSVQSGLVSTPRLVRETALATRNKD